MDQRFGQCGEVQRPFSPWRGNEHHPGSWKLKDVGDSDRAHRWRQTRITHNRGHRAGRSRIHLAERDARPLLDPRNDDPERSLAISWALVLDVPDLSVTSGTTTLMKHHLVMGYESGERRRHLYADNAQRVRRAIRRGHERAYAEGVADVATDQVFEYLGITLMFSPDVMPITPMSHHLGRSRGGPRGRPCARHRYR